MNKTNQIGETDAKYFTCRSFHKSIQKTTQKSFFLVLVSPDVQQQFVMNHLVKLFDDNQFISIIDVQIIWT